MTDYAIGDIQGCYERLLEVLAKVDFSPSRDRLWVAGDLINRGPSSLETLRYVESLGSSAVVVLGNHDLHLLAVAQGSTDSRRKDTLTGILEAPDRDALLGWLRDCPLLVDIPEHQAVMTHAGIPPLWTLPEARQRAREVEQVLRGPQVSEYFANMYGNQPAGWDDALQGPERWRVITNHFTRMRFVDQAGDLDLGSKGEADAPPEGFMPWFQHPHRQATDTRILFGHWAALEGHTDVANVDALDTGCVWGGSLTALRLDDLTRIACHC